MLVISNHRLDTVIAHGVTSEVWSAARLGPGGFAQTVALKTLTPLHAASTPHARAFLNEARAASHVHHPHVVRTHALLEEDGRYWLSMDLVRGWTLRSLVATLRLTRRVMPLEIAVALVRDAAAGIHAIHSAGLLHRHVTPDNVLASSSGHAVVIDFGCAAWQLAEQVRFTAPLAELDASYASPQMVGRQRVDVRTDVYSLGAVLHELIAGEPPPASTPGRRQIIVAPSSWRPDLPPALEGIIARALEPEPMVRFSSALDVERALEAVAVQQRWPMGPSMVSSFLADAFSGTSERRPRPDPSGLVTTERTSRTTPPAGIRAPSPATAHVTSRTTSRTGPVPSRPARPTAPPPSTSSTVPRDRDVSYGLQDMPTDPFVRPRLPQRPVAQSSPSRTTPTTSRSAVPPPSRTAPTLPRVPAPVRAPAPQGPPLPSAPPRRARGSDAPPPPPARPAPPPPIPPPRAAARTAAPPVARPGATPPTPAELANGSGARRMKAEDLIPTRSDRKHAFVAPVEPVPQDPPLPLQAGPGVRSTSYLGQTRVRLRRR